MAAAKACFSDLLRTCIVWLACTLVPCWCSTGSASATMADMSKRPLTPSALGYAQADKRLEILQLVGQHGSISQAARTAGVSYKAAWQAIHTLTNLAGEPLVDSSVGGAGGGGARLTSAGARLLEAAGQMDAARRGVLARLNHPAAGSALTGPRTSMRNHLRCAVQALHSAGARDPLVRVALDMDGGGTLAARITRESAELLALTPGLPLLALCKATAVRVLTEVGAAAMPTELPMPSCANRLPGRALTLSRGSQHDEVTLTLAGGQQLVGFALRPNRLRAGSRVVATVDDSAVVLALTG